MAPIDLPPEPSLNQPPTVSISAAAPQIKQGSEARYLLTNLQAAPNPSTVHLLDIVAAPTSLIPLEQLSETSFEDFSQPNLTQLPPLPPETDSAPASEEAQETINDAIDDQQPGIDILENIEPAGTDLEPIEQPLETHSPDAIDLDNVEPNDIDLDGVNTNERATDAPDINQVTDVLEDTDSENSDPADSDTDVDGATSEDRPTENSPEETPAPPVSPPATNIPSPLDPSKLEVTADTQSFDANRQVVTARGNVVFKLNNAFLLADEMWINLNNRYVLAEGNVILTRGEQEVRGERAEYNLLQESGTIFETRGELFLPGLDDDFSSPLERPLTSRSVFDPLNPDQELNSVTATGGLQINSRVSGTAPSSLPDTQGNVRRLRFEAARVNFDSESWVAEEVRLTNDPFSPPELEFRTDRITLVTLSPTADLLTTEDPRLVFDQGFALPLLKSRYVINRGDVDSNQVNPFLVSINSDSRDRGGVFLESEVPVFRNESVNFSITPQYFVERAIDQGLLDSEVFGIESDLNIRLSERSNLSASVTLTSFNFDELEDNLRSRIRNRYLIGNHLLVNEYTYRNRLFNGSLGFQDVRSSLGSVLLSPPINLDGRGLILTYQVGGQLVTAKTDRPELVDEPLGNEDLATLGRFQGSARLSKGFNLWRGKPLPATQTEGLRYSPVPLVPFLNLNVSLFGVGSYYTNGDFQEVVAGDVRIDGQIGHLSNNFFDYTRFNLGYYQELISGNNSPFLFDRNVDDRILTFGVVQQIVGPILLGFQTSINLDTREEINTEIIGEYSRRTYGLVVRYSPTQSTGSIGFRLSDFNWLGNSSPFDSPNIRQVESGVVEQR